MTLDSLLAKLEKRSVTPVTLTNVSGVTNSAKETKGITPVTLVTCHFTKEAIEEWIYNNPPVGSTIYNCAYCGHEFDFKVDSYMAWGDVYCCHGGDKDHLKSYMKSREREAVTYLKSIEIKRN